MCGLYEIPAELMLTKGIMEFVAYILGKKDLMLFDHQIVCQRGNAFLLQHMNIHDTKRANHHKRNLEFKNLLIHPFQEKKRKRKSLREVLKPLNHG